MSNSSKNYGWIFVLFAVCLFIRPVEAKYSGGTGEPNDPYQINTAEDLMLLSESPEDYDKHFVLTANIDLDPNLPGRKVFDKAVIAPDTDQTKSWFQGTPFTGFFDGNGHTILRLTIRGKDYTGLFGQSERGVIRDLGVVDANVTGSGEYVAGLVGWNEGTVTRCYSTGSISGSIDVGGLVGSNRGPMTQCLSTATVSSTGFAGGLAGAGWNVRQCYSTGAVEGGSCVGGLMGAIYGTVAHCYSTGRVRGTGFQVGGLSGSSGGAATDCFWDIQTSGQSWSDGGTGKTTAEMQRASTFLNWITCGNEGVWTIDEGNDYPRLAWEHRPGRALGARLSDFLAGSGSEDDPYLICTAQDIETIASFPCEHDRHFRLMFLGGKGPKTDRTGSKRSRRSIC